MDNYEPGAYTEGVMTNIQHLTKNVIPEFISQVSIALESLSKNTVHLFDDNQFVDISKKVYDTIHNIRCSVMMIRTPEELEDVSDLEDDHDARSRTSIQIEGKTDRLRNGRFSLTTLSMEDAVHLFETGWFYIPEEDPQDQILGPTIKA
ncbi:PREDICTED: catenin alpha-3-like, partial [Eurypyga helias]|uniref:catenin alpha-3-like n=1 Tax=Eurypyga helias TaxID=54383 RepID=UPI0005284ABC